MYRFTFAVVCCLIGFQFGGMDTDGDGQDDMVDPYPNDLFNLASYDQDNDGLHNGSDPDCDGDGIPNNVDLDADSDGIQKQYDLCDLRSWQSSPYTYNPGAMPAGAFISLDNNLNGYADTTDEHYGHSHQGLTDPWMYQCTSNGSGGAYATKMCWKSEVYTTGAGFPDQIKYTITPLCPVLVNGSPTATCNPAAPCYCDGVSTAHNSQNTAAPEDDRDCELCTDTDGDGVCDDEDNCPNHSNADQVDTDLDGIGDMCEAEDTDGDGIPDNDDNCPYVSNQSQDDPDNDHIGSACDNCDLHSNANQQDSDLDGTGDACDGDTPQSFDGVEGFCAYCRGNCDVRPGYIACGGCTQQQRFGETEIECAAASPVICYTYQNVSWVYYCSACYYYPEDGDEDGDGTLNSAESGICEPAGLCDNVKNVYAQISATVTAKFGLDALYAAMLGNRGTANPEFKLKWSDSLEKTYVFDDSLLNDNSISAFQIGAWRGYLKGIVWAIVLMCALPRFIGAMRT